MDTIILWIGGVDMESNEILAENLKKYRVRYGISQEELAHKSGFSTRSYGKIERGEVHTSLVMVDKLACGTELSSAELLSENLEITLKDL